MGYITDFNLKLYHDKTLKEVSDEDTLVLIAHKLTKKTGYHFDQSFYVNGKWYNFIEDIEEVSTHYPDVLFMLEGDGEESGDVWTKVFFKGKLHNEWRSEYTRPTIKQLLKIDNHE